MEMEDENKKDNNLLLRHGTYFEALYKILESGYLASPAHLKIKGSGHDNNAIFFTPVTTEFVDNDDQISLYLDLNGTISNYDSFFINNGNHYSPLDGRPDKTGDCDCLETFHNNLDQTKYPDISETKCYRTYDEMIELVTSLPQDRNLFEYCDGGPEMGVFSPTIELDKLLKYVILPNRRTLLHETKFLKEINKTMDESFEDLEKMITKYGGIMIEKEYKPKTKTRFGGNKRTKNNKKKQAQKRINKTRKIKTKTKTKNKRRNTKRR